MSLGEKNLYVTVQLVNNNAFKPFYPQDLTIRIEDLITSEQAKKLNLTEVKQALELLLDTDAVRTGDFVKNKSKWYTNETLPQLPFFFDAN
ncbi:hypothetical protein D3C73_1417160 [compost metagenome]